LGKPITKNKSTRLSKFVRPTTIDLHFHLDPKKKTFHGTAHYTLQLEKRTRKLELHCAELRVSRVRLQVGETSSRPRVAIQPESESIVLHFDRLLPAESVSLELDFRGRVRNDLRGLYRSVDQEMPWLATQLCPTDARRFFPCFDEPGIKAKYRIRVTTTKDQTVLSNSPVEFEADIDADADSKRSTDQSTKQKTVQFETTPPLSAYLIAVLVGPFVATPARMSGSTPIRVYTLPDRQHLARFALETAHQGLSHLEKWFRMEHPYAKLDLVALPDFAFGAMENAGAVFFRDSVLLLDSKEASFEARKRAAETIVHEISHMWFGNLVTMAWWNDLWLNESFATWMAYEIIEQWQPEWQIWLDFAHRREEALAIDALKSSHPIAPVIRNAQEAHENFDAITYTKGACVLRMLEGFLGSEVFRNGILLYINRYKEGAASAGNLWAALSESSGLPIEKIVAPWTVQTGYPLVSLRRTKPAGKKILELKQQRFLALPEANSRKGSAARRSIEAKARKASPRWQIPWVGRGVRRRGGKSEQMNHLLVNLRNRFPMDAGDLAWLYGNAREAGFFRIEHGEAEFEDLISHLPALSTLERIGFVGHQWALARSGRQSVSRLLDLLAALGEDGDPDVLFAVASTLGRLSQRLAPSRGSEVEHQFRNWIAAHFERQLRDQGLMPCSGENLRTRLRRAQLFRILGPLAKSNEILEHCVKSAAKSLSSGKSLSPELGDVIIRIAASQGDREFHQILCAATRKATTPQARRRMLFGLAEFDEPALLRATFKASVDSTLAPAPDRAALLTALLARPTTAAPTWRHLTRVWPRLERQMPPILLARLAGSTADALPYSMAHEIKEFFKGRPLTAGSRVLRQVAEEMSIAKRFDQMAGAKFEDHLSDS
jgi:puromycin-sensitive aminopeptidase